jgi:hypothetical protein
MSTNAMSIVGILTPEKLADEVSLMWTTFKNARTSWEAEMLEIRNYKYATSTRTTEVGDAGFNNSTTIPKLSQIATNLKANYDAHLFGNPNWIQFEPFDSDAAAKEAKANLEAYARTKARRKDYEGVLNTNLDDWIDTGVTFAQQRYVTETYEDSQGHPKVLYQGPVLERIPPSDIVFDVTASSWKAARKVIRKSYTLGDIARMIQEDASSPFTQEHLDNMRTTRHAVRSSGISSAPSSGIDWKNQALSKDGFGSMLSYMNSDVVEVLEFYGDMYSVETGEFFSNHKIVVADRRLVISNDPIRSPNGSQYIYYCGWEDRPQNLMAISPLARLVGMQYKLDKLENLRADAFDRIVHPPTVEVGDVEFYGTRGAPGGRYVVDENGSVSELHLDATVLNADFQIQQTMSIMEEMAGSPRNSSGFRTPGEKTKFEVQFLDNGGNRIFRNKTNKFEREFIELILADMIELGKDNLGDTDLVSTQGTEFNVLTFLNIKSSDLYISGKLRARGSRLFAEKANALQNILGIMNSGLANLIGNHISRIALAKAVEDLAEISEYNIIIPNIGIQEDQASAQLANQAQQSTQEVDAVNTQPELDEELQ